MPAPHTTPPDVIWVEEEGTLFLPTQGTALGVELDGQGLTSYEDPARTPYLLDTSPGGVDIRLTDRIGRLNFQVRDSVGVTVHPCLVYPGKLARDPQQAFTALARLTDALPQLTAGLGFPQQSFLAEDLARRRPLSTAALLPYASRARQLWQEARRTPRATLGHTRRTVHGGTVPDRVDWAMTLDHWGLGGFPDHVARDLSPLPPPIATAALHDLWDVLVQAVHLSFSPDAPELLGHFQQARKELPARPVPGPGVADAITRTVRDLTAQVGRLAQQAQGLPQGWARMAGLYEVWAMLTFAQALGATEGQFVEGADGLYEGTLNGPGLTVTLNPKLSFQGTGAVQRYLRPDVFVVFETGEALVADVKYRALHRLPTEIRREIDDQMLRYMGLSHARTGLVLWPGHLPERVWQGQLPGERAKLARLRLHPLDSPAQRANDLQNLGLLGVN